MNTILPADEKKTPFTLYSMVEKKSPARRRERDPNCFEKYCNLTDTVVRSFKFGVE